MGTINAFNRGTLRAAPRAARPGAKLPACLRVRTSRNAVVRSWPPAVSRARIPIWNAFLPARLRSSTTGQRRLRFGKP